MERERERVHEVILKTKQKVELFHRTGQKNVRLMAILPCINLAKETSLQFEDG